MPSGGHNRKTTAQHFADGTFRADRHDRTTPVVDGVPMPPSDLSGIALELWEAIESHVVAIGCGEVDSVMLADACRWYAAFRVALEAGDTSEAARCWRPFNSIAVRYGLTIGDRQKLELPSGESDDELTAMHFGPIP